MFGRGLKLPFKILGIDVKFDLTFLLVLPLFTWMLGGRLPDYADILGMRHQALALMGGYTPYAIGFLAASGLFLSVLIHEFGHALTARIFGVKTRSITLWLLGGLAALERIPEQRGAEAVVAIVGPLTSFALAGLLAIVYVALPIDGGTVVVAVRLIVGILSITNLALAIFNLIPALPLDGGRVLRSLLALATDRTKATLIAGVVSKVLAVGLALLAIAPLLLGGGGFDPFLLLVALFVYFAVNAETRQTQVEAMLRGVKVGDLMNRQVVTVRPEMAVGELMALMIRERHLGFPVAGEDGRVIGTVGLRDLQESPVDGMDVGRVMNTDVHRIAATAPAREAFEQMGQRGFGRMVVTDGGGAMVGIVTKADLMRLIQVRAATQVAAQHGVVGPPPLPAGQGAVGQVATPTRLPAEPVV